MRRFIQTHLDPVDRLGEVVFGLIMALGVIGACRLEAEEPNNHAMLIGVLGCNLAWAIVDGVMFACASLFERGMASRLVGHVRAAPDDQSALQHVAREFDPHIEALTTPEQRQHLYLAMMEQSRRCSLGKAKLRREDVLGGIAVAVLVMVATLPVVAPFLIVRNPLVAVRAASGVALLLLFLTGSWWGYMVGGSALRIGGSLALVGLALALLAIVLGG